MFKYAKCHKLRGGDMSIKLASKEDTSDRERIYRVLENAQNEGRKMTRTTLRNECGFLSKTDRERFEKVLNELIKEGSVREGEEKIKVGSVFGIPKKENILEAVKPPKVWFYPIIK